MSTQPPPVWSRDTTWRQGQVISNVLAKRLGALSESVSDETCIVVVSHDCDIAHEDLAAEPRIEVILGRILSKPDGNFLHAKTPRTLHLPASRNGVEVTLELVATQKMSVAKADILTAGAAHDPDFYLAPKELNILRYWLGIRYNRAAFPDHFDKRMRATKLGPKLAAIVARNLSVSAIYFDVDSGLEKIHDDGTPHELSIVIAYQPGEDPSSTAEQADKTAELVEALIAKTCFNANTEVWSDIKLKRCIAYSEDELTVTEAKALKQWRLEYLSLRDEDDPAKPFAMDS